MNRIDLRDLKYFDDAIWSSVRKPHEFHAH